MSSKIINENRKGAGGRQPTLPVSPPQSPCRPNNPSQLLERKIQLNTDTMPPTMTSFITAKTVYRKPSLKTKQNKSIQKSVRWHPDVVENEYKKRLLREKRLLAPRPSTRDFESGSMQPMKIVSPPLGATSVISSPSVHADFGAIKNPHRPGNLQQPKNIATTTTSNTIPSFQRLKTSSKAFSDAKSGRRLSPSSKYKVPPYVPEPEPRQIRRPPPTPRPERLPTPDLTEIESQEFCECCATWTPSFLPQDPWWPSSVKPKWELQFEGAVAYMQNQKF